MEKEHAKIAVVILKDIAVEVVEVAAHQLVKWQNQAPAQLTLIAFTQELVTWLPKSVKETLNAVQARSATSRNHFVSMIATAMALVNAQTRRIHAKACLAAIMTPTYFRVRLMRAYQTTNALAIKCAQVAVHVVQIISA